MPACSPRALAGWAVAAMVAVLPIVPAHADPSADLGGAQFSQRVVTDLVTRRAQVQALRACDRPHHGPPPPPGAPPTRDLPLSPPVGTGGPVPDGPHPCQR